MPAPTLAALAETALRSEPRGKSQRENSPVLQTPFQAILEEEID